MEARAGRVHATLSQSPQESIGMDRPEVARARVSYPHVARAAIEAAGGIAATGWTSLDLIGSAPERPLPACEARGRMAVAGGCSVSCQCCARSRMAATAS